MQQSTCDDVIDFDKVMRDPTHPTRLLPLYDSTDHIHPNDAGYKRMVTLFNYLCFL